MMKYENFEPADLKLLSKDARLYHMFDEDDCYALWAAHSANRPLLLRGDPGTGKSQLARAIAHQLGWAFVSEVIHANSELSDLHWSFDAVARLATAQTIALPGVMDTNKESVSEHIAPHKYLAPGAFWWAYDWKSAQQQYDICKSHLRPAPVNTGNSGKSPKGVVLLIDEIDKADPDLPNGLLETLGNMKFPVPYLNQDIEGDKHKLLVICTTNEERELPSAFKRRCFVHTLKMDEHEDTREDWLIRRGQLHFGHDISTKAYQQAAKILWMDRESISDLNYKPGLAEYIDLLKAVSGLDKEEQENRLNRISKFVLQKEMDTD